MKLTLSCDDNYVPYLSVCLLSILKCNKNVIFYILDLGISKKNQDKIDEIVKDNGGVIYFIPINKEDFSVFPQTIKYISIATYARLKLASYLEDLERVIYIDVDTLTIGSIEELWNLQLSDENVIAACFDSFIEFSTDNYKETIGLKQDEPYFNAGVLLIDIKKFQNMQVYEKAIAYLNTKPNIHYQDQDILNVLFKGRTQFISPKFNFMPMLRSRIKKRAKLDELEKDSIPISIIHYCGSKKPWHNKCSHTKSSYFLELYNSIPNKPVEWESKVEELDLINRFSRYRKDFRDKLLYGIQ